MISPGELAHARMLAAAEAEGRLTQHFKDGQPTDGRTTARYHVAGGAPRIESRNWNGENDNNSSQGG